MNKIQGVVIDEYLSYLKYKNTFKNVNIFPGLTEELYTQIKQLMKSEIVGEIYKLNIDLCVHDFLIIYLSKDSEFERRLEKDFPQIF